MLGTIYTIASLEVRKITKSWLFWVGVILVVGIPVFTDSPLSDGHLWIAPSAAYAFAHGASSLGPFYIPLLMLSLFYNDDKTKITKVIFTQPIKGYQYALGKFFGGFFSYLYIVLIGLAIIMLIPLYFGYPMYSPLILLKAALIYTIPSMFFYSALSYIVVVILKTNVLAILIPMMYMFIIEAFPAKFHFRIDGNDLATLSYGEPLSRELYSFILTNRILMLSIGALLLIIAVNLYSPARNIEGR